MCTFCNGKEFFAVALSKLAYTLSSIAVQVVGFDSFNRPYPSCKDFSTICVALVPRNSGEYGDFLHDWYCFKGTQALLTQNIISWASNIGTSCWRNNWSFWKRWNHYNGGKSFLLTKSEKMWLRMSPDIEPANYQRGKGRI